MQLVSLCARILSFMQVSRLRVKGLPKSLGLGSCKPLGLGSRIDSLGCRVQGGGFRVQVKSTGFGGWGWGFALQGLVQGLGFGV
jgi:hypothetical protein